MKKKNGKSTQSKLARRLGVSRQLISKHARKGGSPPVDDVEAWGAYLAAVGREGSAPAEWRTKIAAARERVLRATWKRLEMENARRCGENVSKTRVTRFIQDLVANIFCAELDRMCQELPALLKGRNEREISAELVTQKEIVRKAMFARLDGWKKEKD